MEKKKTFLYVGIFLICVVGLVLYGLLCEGDKNASEANYQSLLEANQESIRILEEEITTLRKENAELRKKVDNAMTIQSDITTGNQAMSDLRDIFELYKSGKAAEAKKTFNKIEPLGFDDNTLGYYELLKYLLEK